MRTFMRRPPGIVAVRSGRAKARPYGRYTAARPRRAGRSRGVLLLGQVDRGLERGELAQALLVLGRRIGVVHDSGARLQVRTIVMADGVAHLQAGATPSAMTIV